MQKALRNDVRTYGMCGTEKDEVIVQKRHTLRKKCHSDSMRLTSKRAPMVLMIHMIAILLTI